LPSMPFKVTVNGLHFGTAMLQKGRRGFNEKSEQSRIGPDLPAGRVACAI